MGVSPKNHLRREAPKAIRFPFPHSLPRRERLRFPSHAREPRRIPATTVVLQSRLCTRTVRYFRGVRSASRSWTTQPPTRHRTLLLRTLPACTICIADSKSARISHRSRHERACRNASECKSTPECEIAHPRSVKIVSVIVPSIPKSAALWFPPPQASAHNAGSRIFRCCLR